MKTPSASSLPTAIEHEACDVTSSSAQKLDSNGDGKPDIVRVLSGGREVCRMVDLNHDDRPDSYIYFDGVGVIQRRESDFDRDGRIDEIAYYAAGTWFAKTARPTSMPSSTPGISTKGESFTTGCVTRMVTARSTSGGHGPAKSDLTARSSRRITAVTANQTLAA